MRRFGLIAVPACVYACATGGGASRAPVTFEIGSVEAWRSLKPGTLCACLGETIPLQKLESSLKGAGVPNDVGCIEAGLNW